MQDNKKEKNKNNSLVRAMPSKVKLEKELQFLDLNSPFMRNIDNGEEVVMAVH